MATIYLAKNDANGNHTTLYKVGNLNSFSYDINTPLTSYPLPEFDSDKQVLIKIDGNSSPISIAWKLKQQPENQVRLGTAGFPVDNTTPSQTPLEQIRYFRNTFRPVSITDRYSILIDFTTASDGFDDLEEWNGGISKIHFDINGDHPTYFNAQVDFMEGDVVSIFEEDTPSQPLNVVVTGGAGEFTITWDDPEFEGTTAIWKFVIEYAKNGNPYSREDVLVAAPNSETITGLDAGTYRVRIFAMNDQGAGRKSIDKIITVT